jgi:hypothetical protein
MTVKNGEIQSVRRFDRLTDSQTDRLTDWILLTIQLRIAFYIRTFRLLHKAKLTVIIQLIEGLKFLQLCKF